MPYDGLSGVLTVGDAVTIDPNTHKAAPWDNQSAMDLSFVRDQLIAIYRINLDPIGVSISVVLDDPESTLGGSISATGVSGVDWTEDEDPEIHFGNFVTWLASTLSMTVDTYANAYFKITSGVSSEPAAPVTFSLTANSGALIVQNNITLPAPFEGELPILGRVAYVDADNGLVYVKSDLLINIDGVWQGAYVNRNNIDDPDNSPYLQLIESDGPNTGIAMPRYALFGEAAKYYL